MTTPLARLAADIGGTFTDVALEVAGRIRATKVLTTPKAPEEAVVAGARIVLAEAGLEFADLDVFLHGTTLATNAIIERKGAPTGLITTQGFRDVVEIADESRFDQYDVFLEKPAPLVPRALRLTVPERMDVEGQVRLPLDESAVANAAKRLAAAGVEAIAIGFLHSYVNPAHEQRARDIVEQTVPGMAISLSSEVSPEAREYERFSTAIANAYVQPLMAGYLARLEAALRAEGSTASFHLMTSGGSLASLDTARRFPVRLIESGPAGGAILAASLAAARREPAILSFDMGGTTAKICLIDKGAPLKARTFEVDRSARFMKGSGLPLRIPVIEMVEIGAGGGSIARVDTLKRIVVGPDSAGAEPGPAAYGRGGTMATVTDADVVLGKIDPARFAGGRIPITPAKAAAAIEAAVGAPLGLDVQHAAHAIAEIVDENMANAARVHAVERGAAIGGRTLIAFGGAAPLHAARLAEKLAIARVIVPVAAGVGSAMGFLAAPAAYEIVRSRYARLDALDLEAINALLTALEAECTEHARSAAGERSLTSERGAFMRYAGQGHEILVPLPRRALVAGDAETLRVLFENEYRNLFARHIPGAAIEIMSWRVAAFTPAPQPEIVRPPARTRTPLAISRRTVWDAGAGRHVEAAVHDRSRLEPGDHIPGPAIIVEDGTSTLVASSFDAMIDGGGAIVMTRKVSSAGKRPETER